MVRAHIFYRFWLCLVVLMASLNVMASQGLVLQDFELQTPSADATSVKIQMKRYVKDNKSIRFTIHNDSEKAWDNIHFVLLINGKAIEKSVFRIYIEPGKVEDDIRFDLLDDLIIDESIDILLQAKHKDKIITEWRNIKVGKSSNYEFLTGAILLLFLLFLYLTLFFHPLVKTLSADHRQLLSLPLSRLGQAKWLLRLTWRLSAVLAANDSHRPWLDAAIRFPRQDAGWQSTHLAKRLNAQCAAVEARLFEWRFGVFFPLNLNSCGVYFPDSGLHATDIVMRLQQDDLAEKFVVVIAPDHAQFAALRQHGVDRTTLWVVPDSRDLTALLLSPEPVQGFVKLLSSQLAVTTLSPYQTSGGVKKDRHFFGRERILSEIFNREPANYLLLGGRQLGKTSLLKHIQRRYQNHPRVTCHFLSLSSDKLLKPLARALGVKTEAEGIFEALAAPGQRRLLLIDEADAFIRADSAAGYPLLARFRALSEEGSCFFILAGFWELYQAAVWDYQSPLRNFAKPVIVGELEADACRALATEPMGWLGIDYADPGLVAEILTRTGQRANLIALAGDEMLKAIGPRRTLNATDVAQALTGQAMERALSGWTHLSADEAACRVDQRIVYATLHQDRFDLETVAAIFAGEAVSREAVLQALERLKLAFIVRESGGHFGYCVPLFQEIWRRKGRGGI